MKATSGPRRFLFLQGPHGPYFWQLGKALRAAGCDVLRVGFNAGDRLFWPDSQSYCAYTDTPQAFEPWLDELLSRREITDLVLYGEVRPLHKTALERARASGITTHIFEEGYLRPYWVTYERSGTNGNSRLIRETLEDMARATRHHRSTFRDLPAHWGAMREHVFYGALYHLPLLFPSRRYRNYVPHRDISVRREASLHFRRLAQMPLNAVARWARTRRFRRRAVAYHLCLLQLAHDASVLAHSNVGSTESFIDHVIHGFASGAPKHHHLAFKAHPLEDGRLPLNRLVRARAKDLGIESRVHFLNGGKLAHLLDGARSVVTINSTAAQQALWRGLPVKAMGDAVYVRPELVSSQPLREFFPQPDPPDVGSYKVFRAYLLSTCQYTGSFYSAAGRRTLLPTIVDVMLDPTDPFDQVSQTGAAEVQHIRLVQ